MDDKTNTAYEEIPYHSQPYRLSHPDNLATIAILCGVPNVKRKNFKLLEIGCAAGNNLVPLAYSIPESQFTGIDLVSSYIESGRSLVEELSLTNIELLPVDLATLDDNFGQFDYIVAHGVHSWIDRALQTQLMRVIKDCLAPNGLAYVSYNTYPGWHIRNIIRDALLFVTRNADSANDRIRLARSFIDIWIAELQGEDLRDTNFLSSELTKVQALPDWYLLHDLLEGINDPVYVHDFIEQLRDYELAYLADAEPGLFRFHDLTSSALDVLNRISAERCSLEQYSDFLRLRTFRRSVITHGGIQLSESDIGSNLATLLISVPRESSLDHFNDDTSSLLEPVQAQWPRRFEVASLIGNDKTGRFTSDVLRGFQRGILELHAQTEACVTEVHELPVVSALARAQAKRGSEVTNLSHEVFVLGELEREIVLLMDGSRNRNAVVEVLRKYADEAPGGTDFGGMALKILESFRDAMLLVE